MADPIKIAYVCDWLTQTVRSLVTDKEAVEVVVKPAAGHNIKFRVRVAVDDAGKVIGMGGRTVRSLRILLQAIAKETGESF